MKILDFSSGNTCKNDFDYIRKMIDELSKVDDKGEFVIKWQLFKEAGENIPLERRIFHHAYWYARDKGFQTTASVFDSTSLEFLLQYEIPFVKIACKPNLYNLTKEIKRGIPVVVSYKEKIYNIPDLCFDSAKDFGLCCIPKYPASIEEYEKIFSLSELAEGISDHTENWDLYKKYTPWIYECHFKLNDSTGLDAGSFARTPEQLKELLDITTI